MPIRDTWFDVYATAQFGPALRAALGLWLALTVAALSLLGPLAAWLLVRLLAANGGPAIDAVAAAAVFGSPVGLGLLAGTGAVLSIGLWLGLAGVAHIAAGASRAATPRSIDALVTGIAALPRLLGVALWQMPAVGGAVLLAGAGLLGALFGSGAWRLLGGGVGLVALVLALRLLADWVLALPVVLYQEQRGRAALGAARALIDGHRWRALRLLLTNLALALGIAAGLGWLAVHGVVEIIGQTPPGPPLVARTLLAIALVAVLALPIGCILLAVYPVTAMHLYFEVQGLDGLPGGAWASTARSVRLKGLLAGASLWGVLFLLFGGAIMLSRAATENLGLDRQVLVVAHRGSSASAPENTLSALYQALADGAEFASIDVQETADGTVVLLHDPNLRRVAGLNRSVWEVQYGDLRRADFGSWFSPRFVNELLTTLREALMVAESELSLSIELQDYDHSQRLADAVAELLLASHCATRCLVTAGNPAMLARMRELAPQVQVGLVVTTPFATLAELDARINAALPPGPPLRLDLLNVDAALLTPALIRANRAAGRATHAGTVDDPMTMAQLIDWGVDAIITNQPLRLRRLLEARKAMSDRQRLLMTLGRQLQ